MGTLVVEHNVFNVGRDGIDNRNIRVFVGKKSMDIMYSHRGLRVIAPSVMVHKKRVGYNSYHRVLR
jgi:hypothetical protein